MTRVKVGDRIIGTIHPRRLGGPITADYLTDRLGANLHGMLAHYAVLSEEAPVPMPGHRTPDREAEVDLIAMIGHMLKSAPLGGFVVAVYQAMFDAH